MLELDRNLEKYIEDHVDEEDPVLQELTRETNLKVLHPRMLSGNIQGKFLEIMSKTLQPKSILEIGTYTGYSAICLAKGLRKDGRLHTIEINDELESLITKYFDKANINDKVTLHIGDALKIIPLLNLKFDLIFIDGDKEQYLDYYEVALDCLKDDGLILIDNILWSGKILQKPRSNDYQTKALIHFNNAIKGDFRIEKTILPFRDGILMIRKKNA
jgi:predicted O-methyltransferase YrrM